MIHLADELGRSIQEHAERAYPEECCGVLLGTAAAGSRDVREILAIDNSQDHNRHRRFLVTPEQYRAAERAAGEKSLEILGFYHSHPDHPAVPSAFDTEHALPWFVYVIVRVEGGRATDVTAWMLEEDRRRFAPRSIHPAPVARVV
jgi:proteasome lid subunit RPN8/RPN11